MSTLDNTIKHSHKEGLNSDARELHQTPFLPMLALVASGALVYFFLVQLPSPAPTKDRAIRVVSVISAPAPIPVAAPVQTPDLTPGATLVAAPADAPITAPVAAPVPAPTPVAVPVPAPAPAATSVSAPAPVAAAMPANAGCGKPGAFPVPSWYEAGWNAALSGKWPAAFDLWENGLHSLPKNRAVIVGEGYPDLASFSASLNNYIQSFPAIGIRQQNPDGQTTYRLLVCPYGGAIPGGMLPKVQTLFPGAWLINASNL